MDHPLPPLTLLDIKNALYSHFLQKTTFSLKDDSALVGLGPHYDTPAGSMSTYKPILLRAALDEMTKAGWLLALDQVNGIYILSAPLEVQAQQVVITPYTANLLADAFNFFARQTGPVSHVANKLAITDMVVNAVAQMVFAFRDEADELHEMMEGDGPDSDDEMGGPPMHSPHGTPGLN